jgi:hypothetical protein
MVPAQHRGRTDDDEDVLPARQPSARQIQKRRSLSLRRGRNCRRRTTSSCWRSHKFSATNAAPRPPTGRDSPCPHHGNIGPSCHLLAQRSLAVIFRQPEQDHPQFCALQAWAQVVCDRLTHLLWLRTGGLLLGGIRIPQQKILVCLAQERAIRPLLLFHDNIDVNLTCGLEDKQEMEVAASGQ